MFTLLFCRYIPMEKIGLSIKKKQLEFLSQSPCLRWITFGGKRSFDSEEVQNVKVYSQIE